MVLSKIPGAPPISRISSVSPECWAKWVGTKCPKLRSAIRSCRLMNGRFQSRVQFVSQTERFNPRLQCRITNAKYQGRTLVLPHHDSDERGL